MRGRLHILVAILVLAAVAVAVAIAVGAAVVAPADAPAVAVEPLPESPGLDIGYKSVAEALADLKARPGMKVSLYNGWTIVHDEAAEALWSFAPADDPAYPSAVRRQVLQREKGDVLQMKVRCEASKAACDDLVRTFKMMNEKVMGDAAPKAALLGGAISGGSETRR